MDNLTNFTFNCLARDNLSSDSITDPEHWMIAPGQDVAAAILATFYVIFFLIAFCWNLFIIVTYLVKYKLLKEPGNMLLFNLAVGDLLLTVTVMMFSFVSQAAQEFVFGFTDTVRCGVCTFAGFCTMFFVFMSLHLLAALSIDRFILLSFPLRYKKVMTWWKALIVIVFVWIISFVIAMLPFIGFGQYEFNRQFGMCILRFTGDNLMSGLNNFYYPVFCMVEALIPIVILASTNVFTFRLVSKFLKRNVVRRRTFRNERQLEANREEEKKYKHQQNQLVRVFGALFIANIISWTPVIVVVLSVGIAGLSSATQIPNGVYAFGWVCYLTTPVIHPIIESFFVKDLRYQIKRARRTVRKASSAIYKVATQTTFKDSALDEANEAVDTGVESSSKRTIRFFSKEKEKQMKKKKHAPITSVMETEEVELDEMMSSSSPTPEPSRREVTKIGKIGRSVTFTEDSTPPMKHNGPAKSALKRFSEPVVSLREAACIMEETPESDDPLPGNVETVQNGTHQNRTSNDQQETLANGPVLSSQTTTNTNGTTL